MTTDRTAHAMAQTALAHWGNAEAPPRMVKNRENIIFEVRLRDGTRAALRLHRPGYQSRAAIESELDWCAALAGRGFPAPRPVRAINGRLTARAGNRIVSCVEWLEGVPLGAAEHALGPEGAALMHGLGALAARLHTAADAGSLPEGFSRPHWDEEGLLGARPLWGRFWENPALDAEGRALLLAARARLRDRIGAARDRGAIHADLLRENVLATDDGFALIDFDDCGIGFRLYDLGSALLQNLDEPALPQLVTALIGGYRSARPLEADQLRLLPLFVALRAFASAGWIVSRAPEGDPRIGFYAARAVRMAHHVMADTSPWE